jgi:hypothetical protein
MSLQLVSDIWKVLVPSLEIGDVSGAADTLVGYLVDEAYSPTEIKQAFRDDYNIKNALSYFLETPSDGLYHEIGEDQQEYLNFDDCDYEDDY